MFINIYMHFSSSVTPSPIGARKKTANTADFPLKIILAEMENRKIGNIYIHCLYCILIACSDSILTFKTQHIDDKNVEKV